MTMVITVQCPSCATAFPVDPRKIPEKGVKVRCSSCAQVFRVERPAEAAPPPPAVEAPAAVETPATPEAPAAEAPAAEAPAAEAPAAEAPAAEAPAAEAPAAEAPTTEAPAEAPEESPAAEEREETFADWRSESAEAEVEAPEEAAGGFTPAFDAHPTAPAPADEVREVPRWPAESAQETSAQETSAESAARAELASRPVDEWVLETEDDLDASGLDIERVDTVESSVDGVREDVTFTEGFQPVAPPEPEVELPPFEVPEPGVELPPLDVSEPPEEEMPPAFGTPLETPTDSYAAPAPEAPAAPEPTLPPPPAPPVVPEIPEAPPAPAAPEPPPAAVTASGSVGAFTFGKRDPKDKARRLARVLVSDMIMYNPQRHERALANGTLKEDFEDEIQKSWKEYVEQVGEEMARGNPFWTDALNDVLAKGRRVF